MLQCGVEMLVKGEDEMVELGNLCGDFFENFDDLLDFPMEDIQQDDNNNEEQEQEDLPPPPGNDAKRMRLGGGAGNFFGPSPPAAARDDSFNPDTVWPAEPDLPAGLHLPYEDFPPLEWMSSLMEDPFASGVALGNDSPLVDNKSSIRRSSESTVVTNNYQRFQSSSPVSVLETSSSNSVVEKAILHHGENFARGRARSKRPRPANFTPRPVVQFMSPATSSITDTTATSEVLSEVEDYAESHLTKKMYELNGTEKKKKFIKKKKVPRKTLPPLPGAKEQPPRKCMHCEITKTPQWRAGPMGPKTLCNACGVRYKSGRLFPEYRPAASPTFVPTKHSNSHRKVLEMRVRCDDEMGSAATMATSEPSNSQLVDIDVKEF